VGYINFIIFYHYLSICRKRYKIGPLILWNGNGKSHSFYGIVTLNFWWPWVTFESNFSDILPVVTLCAQLTRDLFAIAKFLFLLRNKVTDKEMYTPCKYSSRRSPPVEWGQEYGLVPDFKFSLEGISGGCLQGVISWIHRKKPQRLTAARCRDMSIRELQGMCCGRSGEAHREWRQPASQHRAPPQRSRSGDSRPGRAGLICSRWRPATYLLTYSLSITSRRLITSLHLTVSRRPPATRSLEPFLPDIIPQQFPWTISPPFHRTTL